MSSNCLKGLSSFNITALNSDQQLRTQLFYRVSTFCHHPIIHECSRDIEHVRPSACHTSAIDEHDIAHVSVQTEDVHLFQQ